MWAYIKYYLIINLKNILVQTSLLLKYRILRYGLNKVQKLSIVYLK